jgi:hypothetical protein
MTKRELENRQRRVAKAVILMAEIDTAEKKARSLVKTELSELTAADRKHADAIDRRSAERLWKLCGPRRRATFG